MSGAPSGYQMKTTSKRRASLSPEENIARAFRAKCRFRAAVRFVMQNIYWLDDIGDEDIGDDLQKNIMVITRKKDKKSLLTLKEKSILNKAAHLRTQAEKLHLNRIIGGLKCFRRYPPHVKIQLAGVTYYVYYGPGRCIVKEGDEAHALYFIVTGEIAISIITFDPVLNCKVKTELAVMGPGSMFGEVSLLHNIPRTATVHTSSHCELLRLKKDDFNIVLKTCVQREWTKIQNAMSRFTYFSDWDPISLRECCIVATMKKYKEDEVILGDGVGVGGIENAYFILEGQCCIVEHLFVTHTIVNGRKRYKMFNDAEYEELMKKCPEESITVTELVEGPKTKVESKMSMTITPAEARQSRFLKAASQKVMKQKVTQQSKPSKPQRTDILFPAQVETHFMQVCFLNKTACFGLGENLLRRRVVTTQPTLCLAIPRYWLIQKNKGNIWNRIVQFLNNNIPSTKKVFQEFVANKRWLEYRKELVRDILKNKNVRTNNSILNVPYSIRLKEDVDYQLNFSQFISKSNKNK